MARRPRRKAGRPPKLSGLASEIRDRLIERHKQLTAEQRRIEEVLEALERKQPA